MSAPHPHLRLVSETRARGVYGAFEIRRRRMDDEIDRLRDEDRRVFRAYLVGAVVGLLFLPAVYVFCLGVREIARAWNPPPDASGYDIPWPNTERGRTPKP
jgi:hypothetical protein